jgi:hypothetical protein
MSFAYYILDIFPLFWLSLSLFFFLDKEFTAKKIEFVERRTVEYLLKRPCFIDSGGRPRAASILLEYEPSYKSFQKGSIVKNFGQAEVTVARLGRSQKEIIQAVPVTARKEVQVPQLVTPLIEPDFIPSLEPSEVGDPVIRFPSLFDPTHQPDEAMLVQRRSIDIGTFLGHRSQHLLGPLLYSLLLGFLKGRM